MKRIFRSAPALLCVIGVLLSASLPALAHSGRTDSSGGHKDNKNVSGLGSYHYHCGGTPAHLHTGGYCPYTDVFPKKVLIQAEKTELWLGEKIDLSGMVSPSNACSTALSWSSSDPQVARISNGVLEAVGCGTVTITAATFNDKTASLKIVVKERPVEAIAVPETLSMLLGAAQRLSAVVEPAEATHPELAWTCDHPEIVSVSAGGVLTALCCGEAIVTATASNGVSASIVVTVTEVVARSLTIGGNERLPVGTTERLCVLFEPADTTVRDVVWSVDDPSVARVDGNGEVTALRIGTTTVRADQKDVQAAFVLTVCPVDVTEVNVTCSTEKELRVGGTAAFSAAVLPRDATYPAITWSTSDESVAVIDQNGVLTARRAGEVIVIATAEDGFAQEYTLLIRSSDSTPVVLGAVGASVAAAVAVRGKKKRSCIAKSEKTCYDTSKE